MKLKELKKGEWFTRKPIAHPTEKQVYIKGSYNRDSRKYWCIKWADICSGIELKGETEVYTDFIF